MSSKSDAPNKKSLAADKRTLGIAKENERILAAIVQEGGFASELDAAKFAMAHAISKEVSKGETEGTSTKWNIGTVDPDGSLKALVEAIYSDVSEPYRLIEHLINEGLRLLDRGDAATPDVIGLLIGTEHQKGTLPKIGIEGSGA